MPGLNDIIEARMIRKGKWSAYSDMKKDWTGFVARLAREQRLPKMDRAHVSYLLYETSQRRDPSNVLGGAMKFVEDGLTEARVLDNDGWKQILSISAQWYARKVDPGVAVFLSFKQQTAPELFKLNQQHCRGDYGRTDFGSWDR
jgi:hypothetical protein